MWFQRSMEYFTSHFTWKCSNFSLSLGLSSGDKLKLLHFQVKWLVKYSILRWNHIYSRLNIHNFFQSISMTATEIHNSIRWFMRRNLNGVTLTLAGVSPQIPTPRTLHIKRDTGPHRRGEILKIWK